jgi:hypothetical protein
MELRICRKCGGQKPLKTFTVIRPGVRRATCVSCRKEQDTLNNPERVREEQATTHARAKEQRRLGLKLGRWILADSRKSDRRAGRLNDLTRDFIETLIAPGCSYCGETELRMTLDRKDNSKGHTQDNVVPACIRCNYSRGAMPYEAWLCLVPGVRQAKEEGLFGSWIGSPVRTLPSATG